MKKILLVIMIVMLLTGCDTSIEYDGEPVYTQSEVDQLLEELRDELTKLPNPNLCDYKVVFRVQYVERVTDNVYIVEKYGYNINDAYQIYTEQAVVLGSITYVAVYEDGSAVLFSELICVEEAD